MTRFDRTDLVEFLKREVSLCQYLTDAQLAELVDGSRVVSYEPNQAIIEFGEDVTFLGILLDGHLAATVVDGGRHRELIFGDVLVRVSPNYRLAMHIDTDEANAANIRTGMQGYIQGVQTEA